MVETGGYSPEALEAMHLLQLPRELQVPCNHHVTAIACDSCSGSCPAAGHTRVGVADSHYLSYQLYKLT